MAEPTKLNESDTKLNDLENTTTTKARTHKLFGEYKKCKVSYKQAGKEKVSIFVSINSYNLECQQDTVVEIPEKVIELLKEATYTTYHYDEKERKHYTKEVAKYFVELV